MATDEATELAPRLCRYPKIVVDACPIEWDAMKSSHQKRGGKSIGR